MALVTKESLQAMLDLAQKVDGEHGTTKLHDIIGRALVRIFERQTDAEQASNSTHLHNTVGFTGADGRSGALTAKFYLKHKKLLDWQVARWMKNIGDSQYSRITKYHKQLNEVAEAKLAAKEAKEVVCSSPSA